ncbi:hypothetical protein RND81_05G141700 [Saponaria officinalis]
MASAQVLSESAKKDELREAGRRRLEEFRKKKGAKKSAATSQPRLSNSTEAEKQSTDHGPVPVDSAGLAYRTTDALTVTSGFAGDSEKEHGFGHDNGSETGPQEKFNFESGNSNSVMLPVLSKQLGSTSNVPDLEYQRDSIYAPNSNPPIATFGTDIEDGERDVAISLGSQGGFLGGGESYFPTNFYGGDKDTKSSQILPNSNVSSKGFTATPYSEGRFTSLLHEHKEPVSTHPNRDSQGSTLELDHKQHGLTFNNDLRSNIDERRPIDSVGGFFDIGSQRASEGLNSDTSSQVPGISSSAVADTYVRRSRPSFLDSLNIGRDSPASDPPLGENKKFTTSRLTGSDSAVSSWAQDPATFAPVEPFPTPVYSNTSDYFGNGFMEKKIFENSMESNFQFNSQRQTEDFAALEQHIEDLTQEKFSLQRAMEASKALAESLATENSSLTESYNQQASLVSQLKTEMERLQEEIKARL